MSQQVVLLTKQLPSSKRLLEMFEQDCRDRQLSDESIHHYRRIASTFLAYLQTKGLTAFTLDKFRLVEYLRQRRSEGVQQKTLENNFTVLSTLYDYLVFEELVTKNPVAGVRKRFLRRYKDENDVEAESPRKLLTIEEMSRLINSILDTRDKAILAVLAKTGVRRGELIAMDVSDIDWSNQSITLKPKFKKRSNRLVYFDDETSRVLRRWVNQRENLHPETPALFIGERGDRLKRHGVYQMTVKYATAVGLHDPKSKNPANRFGPHSCRHFFTTWLRRQGMSREFIKVLRGDRRTEAIDLYDRIDREELRRAYLAYIPQLGI